MTEMQDMPTEYGRAGDDVPLPFRVVIGANGAYWRDFGAYFSMCPVSSDNDPVEEIASYVPAQEVKRLEEQLKAAQDRIEVLQERADSRGRQLARLEEQLEALRAEMQFVNDVAMSWHAGEEGKARALNVIATRSGAAWNPASSPSATINESAETTPVVVPRAGDSATEAGSGPSDSSPAKRPD